MFMSYAHKHGKYNGTSACFEKQKPFFGKALTNDGFDDFVVPATVSDEYI